MSDNQNDGGGGNASGGDGQQGQSQQQNQNDGGTQGQRSAGAGDGQSGQQQGSGGAGDQQGQSQAGGDKGAQAQSQQQGGEGEGDGAKGYWPEDWRKNLAGEDEKALKRLERYGSPKDLANALFAAQAKISSGQLKTALPENATPEQLAAWRADNGIPESHDKYDVTIAEGHVWGEADKPLIDSFAKAAHEANMTPAAVKSALKWYGDLQAKQVEQVQNEDAQFKKDNVDELRQEWGAEYRMNLRVVDEFFEGLPDGLGEVLLNARDANGRQLAANAKVIRWANQMQREANPLATVLPGGGVNSMQAMEGEITKLKTMMADKNGPYWKGPEAEKHQARYRDLLTAKERAGKRAA